MLAVQQKKVADEIRRDLFSDDDAVVRRAIERCREEGSASVVDALIAFYASGADSALRNEVAAMLGSLKVSGVEGFFEAALKNKAMSHIHRDLITFMWNSDINPSGSLMEISSIAVNGDYATRLECLTLIENSEAIFPEENLLAAIEVLTQHLGKHPAQDADPLLMEMLSNLQARRAVAENDF
jgi:hypothetical protein